VARRSGNRRTERSRQREAVEKQEAQWHVSEHAYRDKEWAEEDCGPVVYKTFWAEGGGGHSYEPMHRY
jgi:hypothetical protein